MSLWPQIKKILARVEKPSRYINHELNSIHKEVPAGGIRVALAYPDTYEVGIPNMGLQILYEILNAQDGVAAERVYAPWHDMEAAMREAGVPLFALESHEAVADFDIFGFTLQHELIYTNILNMLDIAGIPAFADDRGADYPLIIAGGPGAVNPEPLASFFDLFVIGEAEELVVELVDACREWKRRGGRDRRELLASLSSIPGIYVPSLYDVAYTAEGLIESVTPRDGAPARVTRRVVKDLDKIALPERPLVPYMDAVHDRCSVEVMRGCTRGCRFCQAGIIYRPVRERSKETIAAGIGTIMENTGYEEVSLSSLSSADYTSIEDALKELNEAYSERGISISLPSLRIDAFSIGLLNEIAKVKKTGLTFAPEAGTQRMRDVINKNVTEEDILTTVTNAFEAGWQRIKLYFMMGLPTETDEDLDGIADIAKKVVRAGLDTLDKAGRNRLNVVVSVSAFVPKPDTPFQWVRQNTLEEFDRKSRYLGDRLRGKHISYRYHSSKSSVVEGAIARGDRRVADVIYRAWRLGCKFDAWTREFKFDTWMQAFEEAGVDPAFYTGRDRALDERLPWDHIDTGVTKRFLKKEYKRALEGTITEDCRFAECTGCGVCPALEVDNILYGYDVKPGEAAKQ